ncbi:MAG: SPOR domain-containing protein [Balneolaceae bacterium]
MHLDQQKLVELLVEASGIEKSKVEKQLASLVKEIKQAIGEGEAYELEGFGVFSGIGNNVIFIPSAELATEINYKYVGMEAIELTDSSKPEENAENVDIAPDPVTASPDEEELEDDPFGGLLSADEGLEETEETPFETESPTGEKEESGLLYDIAGEEGIEGTDDSGKEDEIPSDPEDTLPEEQPGPEKWGIDTYKDDTAENTFSGMLGNDEGPEDASEDDELSNLFGSTDEEESSIDESELSNILGDTVEEDSSVDEDELSNLLGDTADDDDDSVDENELTNLFGDSEEEEKDAADEEEELSIKLDKEENIEEELAEEGETETEAEEDDEDFDDPFKGLIEDEEEEGGDEEEVVPVITNISSDTTADKEPKEKKREKKKSRTSPKKRQSSPAVLWVVLAVLILGGGVFSLGYFGIVDIPGIPVQTASNQVATASSPATADPESSEPSAEETEPDETAQANAATSDEEPEEGVEEQSPEPTVSGTEGANVNPDQPLYGLKGVSVPEANNGYTIVVYSLSKENSVKVQQEKLGNEGFRVVVTSQPSPQYGQLWRVSLGQFQSLRDAAIAAETLTTPYSENYFITKIQ